MALADPHLGDDPLDPPAARPRLPLPAAPAHAPLRRGWRGRRARHADRGLRRGGYRQFGVEGHHRSCAENLRFALGELGLEAPTTPQPVNLFTATEVGPDGSLLAPPNPVPPGAFVVLEALRDLVCVVSSCPFDLAIPGWGINDPGGPTAIELEVQR